MSCHRWCECSKCTTFYDAQMNEIKNPHSGTYSESAERKITALESQLAEAQKWYEAEFDIRKHLEQVVLEMSENLNDIADYGEKYSPEGAEIWLLAWTPIQKHKDLIAQLKANDRGEK